MAGIEQLLRQRRQEGLLRILQPADSRKEGKIFFAGREYIDFSSNDYLGLSADPHLVQAAAEAAQRYGTGACASRLLSGDLKIHHRLEEATAVFKGKPRALVYNSGYQANLGIISALCSRGDVIFSDKLNHASIIDGIILSGAKLLRFRHNDMGHLEELLKKERHKFKQALIITESIFSMDGDQCPLQAMVGFKQRYKAQLLVDEAHATGIFGATGSGLVEEQHLTQQVDLLMGTFSKALGSFGAYLAGSSRIIDYLINYSRSFIYSTALPAAVIAANLAGLDLVKKQPFRRVVLLENARYLREQLSGQGFKVSGCSQIIPLILGTNQGAIEFSRRLRKRGYWVTAIRPPSVAANSARIRFSLSYSHRRQVLERLVHDAKAAKI